MIVEPNRSDAWYRARAIHKNLVEYDTLVEYFMAAEKKKILSNGINDNRIIMNLKTVPKSQLILTAKHSGPAAVWQIELENRVKGTGDTLFLGTIDHEGILRPSSDLRASDPEFKRIVWFHIKQLRGPDPSKIILEIGKETGICCFCNRELSDPKSVARGCGPDCAAKYGIPDVPPLDIDSLFPEDEQ